MLIPNKFNGYSRDGRRLYHFGGGGGGGDPAPPPAPPPPPRMASAAPPPVFQTYGSGDRTGSLVQSGNSFRPSTLDYSKPIYDPNYADNITGYQESSQFYQPIQQQQYTNYANPLTAFNVSNYGTNSGMSRSMQAATAPGAGGVDPYYRQLQSYGDLLSTQGDRNNINTLMQDMRTYGISAQDLQNASSYTPQMQTPFSYQRSMPQMQTPFNPYTNQYQSPFSYQQPMAQRTSSGPSQAIVGRSSQMRGTPNVMRRAEGGIASLLDNDE
jgi:hypothetical protein